MFTFEASSLKYLHCTVSLADASTEPTGFFASQIYTPWSAGVTRSMRKPLSSIISALSGKMFYFKAEYLWFQKFRNNDNLEIHRFKNILRISNLMYKRSD